MVTTDPAANRELTEQIVAFLRAIGLSVRADEIVGDTVLPGIRVEHGVLVYNPAKLRFPGDLLHEAGHLAVKPPADRMRAEADLGNDPAEEMMAISWSYAAALHLQIPPEVVFHPDGYRGGSASLLQNFAEGHFLAVAMLQWLGLAYEPKQAEALGVAGFPTMRVWVRQA